MQLWDYERRYVLSVDDPRILWDKENVIAVRVFDQGGQGGLYTGNQKLSMVNIKEYLSFDNRSNPFLFTESNISKVFQVKNTSKALTLKGILSIRANNKMTGDEVYNMNQEVTLEPLASRAIQS